MEYGAPIKTTSTGMQVGSVLKNAPKSGGERGSIPCTTAYYRRQVAAYTR